MGLHREQLCVQARIPGYRPGKAPRQVIEKKFRKEIQDELTKNLVSKSYHEAIAEKKLRVVSLTNSATWSLAKIDRCVFAPRS